MKPRRSALLRDALIFMVKLWLDGLKDIGLSVCAIGAIVVDLTIRKDADRYLFYKVVRAGEKFDLWLNLYGASETGAHSDEGFFAASRAGDKSFLGKLEELTGGERQSNKHDLH
jgi:hypothetical protein